MTQKYSYTGECPNLNSEHTIFVDYSEFNVRGQTKPGYKKGHYSCTHSDSCSFFDKYGRCPVYLNAPDEPH